MKKIPGLACLLLLAGTALAEDMTPEDEVLLADLAAKHEVSLADLTAAVTEAKLQKKILSTMDRPYEAKPWYVYRKNFIVPARINEGIDFWLKNETIIDKAAEAFQVNPEIIVAIIGVETFYGKNMGSFRVLDALYTLGFRYPKRAEYFSGEFARFVELANKQGWQYGDIKGSYAGAMGMGQFMPTSYLKWGVDFNNDGHIDLFKNKWDIIGSVAYYFQDHGWKKNWEVTVPTTVKDADKAALMLTETMKDTRTAAELREHGVFVPERFKDTMPIKLLRFDEEHGYSWHLAFHNFRVITTYNRSPLYAMSVYQLSQMIRDGYLNRKKALAEGAGKPAKPAKAPAPGKKKDAKKPSGGSQPKKK